MDNPVTFSDITLLNTLATCANMSTDEVFKDFKIMANKKILKNHKYEIYYSESEKSWRTYLPDETKPNKRRPVKRKSKENLEKEIIRFYLEKQKAENRQNVTLEELYVEWLLYKRDYTSVKAKTIQEYVSEWNRFFKDTELVKMKIGEIKPITLIRFFREATKDRQFTHKRVSNARSVLNGVMSYAIEEEIISHNPVSDVNFKQFTYKPVEVQSDNVFSRDDTHKLLNYLRCIIEPYSLAIQLSFYLFIRVGETKAIRWEDIDYNNRLVYLHRQATCERTLNDDLTFSSRKVKVVNQMKGNTSHGFRKQFLTDEALKILHKAKELNPNGIYVFEPNGEIMTTDSFNRRLKKYCKGDQKSEAAGKAISADIYKIVGNAALKAHKAIAAEAQPKGRKTKEYSTTLLLAICKKYDFGWFVASFWVGDGAICLYNQDNETAMMLGMPDEGEYAGQTRFLTMPEIFSDSNKFYQRMNCRIVPDFTALFLMTDGVSDPKFETDANLKSYDKWNELWADLKENGVELTDDNEEAANQLLNWLDFWSPGNHDDRTIAILY